MKKAWICFTRVPKPGVTKTRLMSILTGEQCAALHTAFLRDLAAIHPQVGADLFVAYTADPQWEMLKPLFPAAAGFFPQEGADLGEKMYHAICHVLLLGYDRVILTGADLPLMTPEHLHSGFEALATADIVLGPTSDGGYYLVGMKQPHRAVFENQSYGGASVLENTVAAAENASLTVELAKTCDDVDTPEDLKLLVSRLSGDTATAQYLRQEEISL